jgi:acyl carrier protein
VSVNLADVLELLAGELDLDDGEIGARSTMDDVENWDSLGHLRVCMALEAHYGVKIPMERVPELTSVPAILALLETD